ncbi:MAG: SDR family NAD(P)-dependent oxidoreductase [Chloroflexi bacterium]|jgi:NAD(P)-dependent dehydrogenase (short-subunit alcohol dehydrogenase family)|nr:MAG: SDR family NAD(P)-dependent oxidoreductase [Chloroflexota bacterium]
MTAVTPLNLFKLDGKTALITGASGGLGEVFAHTLAAAGADIILVGRRLDPLEAMATTLRALYGRTITTYAADVTDVAQIDAMVQAVGTVDILINSAGINLRKPAVVYPIDKWDELMKVNLSAPFYMARAFAPQMISRRWGRIINISSMLGTVGLAERAPYTATKGGLIQLTRTLALEWASSGVTVNALCPGPFATDMNIPIMNNPAAYQWFIDRLPIGRWGDLQDLQGPILFLSSDASAFMTGASMVVDGGWTAQ